MKSINQYINIINNKIYKLKVVYRKERGRPDFRIGGEIPDQLKSTDSDGNAHGRKQWINLKGAHISISKIT